MITNRSIPCSTVIPELPYPDVSRAADWLCGAFGFSVRLRIANHRVQMNVGDGAVVLLHTWPKHTADALPAIVRLLAARGTEFVRLDGLPAEALP